jgi:DNA-binding IclR family transcriptional regulator
MNEAVKSAGRVLDLLELFAVASAPMGVSEVSRLIAIPKSSAQALLATLVSRGYLARKGATYELARDLRRGGWVGGALPRLVKAAEPVMRRLADASGESAFLNVLLPSGELKYVAKAVSPNVVRYDAPLNNTRPAYCTSGGIVLLSYLSAPELDDYLANARLERKTPETVTDRKALASMLLRARRVGYAELCDAHIAGASGVAAPVFDGGDRPIAALSLAAPTVRFVKNRAALRELLVVASAGLSHQLRPRANGGERPADSVAARRVGYRQAAAPGAR